MTENVARAVNAATNGDDDVEDVDRGGREEALLPDQLDEVGDRLQQAVGADAVRPVAELHAAHHLALGERQVRERDEHEVDHDEALITAIHQGSVLTATSVLTA